MVGQTPIPRCKAIDANFLTSIFVGKPFPQVALHMGRIGNASKRYGHQ